MAANKERALTSLQRGYGDAIMARTELLKLLPEYRKKGMTVKANKYQIAKQRSRARNLKIYKQLDLLRRQRAEMFDEGKNFRAMIAQSKLSKAKKAELETHLRNALGNWSEYYFDMQTFLGAARKYGFFV